MKHLESVLIQFLFFLILFGFFSKALPYNATIKGRNAEVYITGSDGKGIKVCEGFLKKGTKFQIVKSGRKLDMVKFGKDAPAECRDPKKNYWIQHEFISRKHLPKVRSQGSGTQTEATACESGNCNPSARGRNSNIGNIAAVVGKLNSANKFISLPGSAGRECSNFVNLDGEIGEYGNRVLNAIRAVDPENKYFLNSPSSQNSSIHGFKFSRHVCPGYERFPPKVREKFWVYLFASIAHDESTCNPAAQNLDDGDGGSDGLFQMEYRYWKRGCTHTRGACRNKQFCHPDQKTNTKALKFQFECTASILRDVNGKKGLDGEGRANRIIGSGSVFWSKLRVPDGDVSNMIKKFPGCK